MSRQPQASGLGLSGVQRDAGRRDAWCRAAVALSVGFPRGFGGGGSGLGEVAGGWRRGAGGHRPARDRGLA